MCQAFSVSKKRQVRQALMALINVVYKLISIIAAWLNCLQIYELLYIQVYT